VAVVSRFPGINVTVRMGSEIMVAKHQYTLCCVMLCLSSIACGCNNDKQKPAMQQPPLRIDVIAKPVLLATISDQEIPHKFDDASPDKPAFYVDFSRLGGGVAYIAKIADRLHVVLNGRAGKPYQTIDNVRVSPDGRRVAYVVPRNGKYSLVVDGRESQPYDDIGAPVFSPDSRHVACKIMSGEQLHIVVDGKLSKGYRKFNGAPVFNAESSRVAYSEGAEANNPARLVVSDLMLDNKVMLESCGNQMVVNAENNRIAAVCIHNGKQRVIDFSFDHPQEKSESLPYDTVSHLSFAKIGTAISYVAEKDGVTYIVLNKTEKRLPRKAVLVAEPVVRPDLQGTAAIMSTMVQEPERTSPPGKPFVYQTIDDSKKYENGYDLIEDFVYNKAGTSHAFAALKQQKWRIVVNGKEGPPFDRVVGPEFSPDGKLLVYRARQDGKRFVVVADVNGKIMRRHQSYELVFAPVFTAESRSVAYGVKDGRELWWKVERLP